ncbi:hypothetical protein ABDK56_05155 [Sphingomonas sp. ASV193]|uniref:hypothetical protein n=1 Tax=Sphingomonas sp. ASV193 TaxID=3144405 RepID=UPI0032E8CBFD
MVIELLILGYAAFLWTLPINSADDVQMQQLWRLMVYGAAIMLAAVFLSGLIASKLAQHRKKEGFE